MEEYEPKTKVSALHLKRDTEMLTDELVTVVQNKASCNIREWLSVLFTNLIYNKIELLKDTLEAVLLEIFVSLERARVGIAGNEDVQSQDSSVWKRVLRQVTAPILSIQMQRRGERPPDFLWNLSKELSSR